MKTLLAIGYAALLCAAPIVRASPDCLAPRLIAPAPEATVNDVRPRMTWEAVPGVKRYRVRLSSREPEGGVQSAIDTTVEGTNFAVPAPLARTTAVVKVEVTPLCAEGMSVAAGRTTEHRFYIDARPLCQLSAPPSIEPTSDGTLLRWPKLPGADRYEVYAYSATDGKSVFTTEARDSSVVLAKRFDGPVAIAVRPVCGAVVGAPIYLLK